MFVNPFDAEGANMQWVRRGKRPLGVHWVYNITYTTRLPDTWYAER